MKLAKKWHFKYFFREINTRKTKSWKRKAKRSQKSEIKNNNWIGVETSKMQDYAKYRLIMLILINVLSAISTIVVGGLLIQALVSPSEIDTTGPLPNTVGQPKINCRADICINEKAEELHTLTVQVGMWYPDTWISGYLDIQAILAIHYPDNKKIEISNYPSIQISVISKYPCIQVSGYIENWDIQLSMYPNIG